MENQRPPIMKFVSHLYRCTQAYTDEKLAEYEITSGTYPFLLLLNKKDGISQNQISAELDVDKALSARAVKKLIEQGYVQRNVDEKDCRAFRLYLTEKGRTVVPKICEVLDEWIRMISEGSTEEEYRVATEFLKRALKNAKTPR